jgi:hypothetical protein
VRSWSVYAAAWIEFRGEKRGCNCLGPKVGRYQMIVSGAEAWRLYLVPPDDGRRVPCAIRSSTTATQRTISPPHFPLWTGSPSPTAINTTLQTTGPPKPRNNALPNPPHRSPHHSSNHTPSTKPHRATLLRAGLLRRQLRQQLVCKHECDVFVRR